MSKVITEVSEAQWEAVYKLRQDIIDQQTDQYTREQITETVNQMYDRLSLPPPEVVIVQSPRAMVHEAERLLWESREGTPREKRNKVARAAHFKEVVGQGKWYIGYFWSAWSGWYQGAKIFGVEFDKEKLDCFINWSARVPAWYAFNGLCIVSLNPTEIHWQDADLHNESGMAVKYADGWGLYSIGGVRVDEQIVMRPETQTIEQIRGEENQEAKRIRIERYGWELYIEATGATVMDKARNDVDGTTELLFKLPDDINAFVGRCRSTGRVYFLEVPTEVTTCAEAQVWLRADLDGNCIGAS